MKKSEKGSSVKKEAVSMQSQFMCASTSSFEERTARETRSERMKEGVAEGRK